MNDNKKEMDEWRAAMDEWRAGLPWHDRLSNRSSIALCWLCCLGIIAMFVAVVFTNWIVP
ncbi:hypothetical protein LCGC14_1619640 [marine sediment metagenome]|uniref:Uncharacterized protein n=1 Tax=marine sediment metagenome TaxID=412755 RepID=A0A0F9I5Z0_9ZZZZ